MKSIKILTAILFSFCLFISFSACNNSSSKHSGTHVHEDGAVHGDHDEESTAPVSQESFNVEADSTHEAEEHHDHDHGDGHSHDHKH